VEEKRREEKRREEERKGKDLEHTKNITIAIIAEIRARRALGNNLGMHPHRDSVPHLLYCLSVLLFAHCFPWIFAYLLFSFRMRKREERKKKERKERRSKRRIKGEQNRENRERRRRERREIRGKLE